MKTSNRMWSGTNSDIAIEIFGTEGHVGKSGLHGSFEKGDTDTTPFYINIGEPYKIRIFHDGSGPSSGWRLDWVLFCIFYTIPTHAYEDISACLT